MGYNTKSNWEIDTRFTGTGGASETVRYICEAIVSVQPDTSNYRMDIELNTMNNLYGDEYYLELNYSVDGSETDFGIQISIHQIGQQIDQDKQKGDDDKHALDNRIISLIRRID